MVDITGRDTKIETGLSRFVCVKTLSTSPSPTLCSHSQQDGGAGLDLVLMLGVKVVEFCGKMCWLLLHVFFFTLQY